MPAKPKSSKRLFASTIATGSSVRALLVAAGFFEGKSAADLMVFWPEPHDFVTVVMPNGQRLLVGHDGDNMLVGDQAIDTLGEAAALLGIDPLPVDLKALPAPTPAELEAAFDALDEYLAAAGPQAHFDLNAYEKRVWAPRWRPEKRNESNRLYMYCYSSGRVRSYCVDTIEGRMCKGLDGEREFWLPKRGYVMFRLDGQEPKVPDGYKLKATHKPAPRRSVVECLAEAASRR
jgi:hypothetical protein